MYNILMYSHDTYGLGHIRRCLAIAAQVRAPEVNVLILTGSPIAGRFALPENVDFVRIPGMIKKTNREYHSLSIRIDPDHALRIRRSIIRATAGTFQPDLFIVDKEPLGLRREVLPTLRRLRRDHPRARAVLGLRDVLDDRDTVRRDWRARDIYRHMEELYAEIWVYGEEDIYDTAREYALPPALCQRLVYTGYLPRTVAPAAAARRVRRKFGISPDQPLVAVTAGGGGDGYEMMDCHLAMLEAGHCRGTACLMVTGPFMPRELRADLDRRAGALGVRLMPFHPAMEEILAAADVVVTMGGYNTLCEIMSQQVPALIVPRETPRLEQLIRARALARQGLVECIPQAELEPRRMGQVLEAMLADPAPYRAAMARFPLRGMESIRARIRAFREGEA